MSAALPELARDDLLARLAAGHAAQTTVITPNRRLAQALAAEFDRRQLAAGRTAWETVDILPYGAFVERLYEDALYSELAGGLPLLLAPEQEQAIWEELVAGSTSGGALLAVDETAALARDAWELVHAWRLLDRLDDLPLDDDAKAFVGWARAYAERTSRARLTDRARLPDVAAGMFAHPWVKKPKLLVAYGFDALDPQQITFLRALADAKVGVASCRPPRREATAIRITAADDRDEIRRAAHWARARLEANGNARIAIVVPDLGSRKNALRRALAQTMDPGGTASVLPFNISLGDPLASYPLVAHALAALELAGSGIEFERASLLLRSPFIALAQAELQQRARLDAKLRGRAEPIVTLDRLVRLIDDGSALAQRLRSYAEHRKQRLFGARPPGDWARAFGEGLALLGFPGERALDSAEYQTLKKWHEVVARLARLEGVVPKIRFDEAFARLRRIAADTIFQPETPAVPIQVLGVLEAAGMEFDHLWVMSLSNEVWPMPPRPNPFIPLRLQRAAQIANATPGTALAFAQRLTAEWLSCAGEVVLSNPRREQDRDLAVSPLVGHFPERELELLAYDTWRDALHRSAKFERLPDARAPALAAGGAVRGGASVLRDQAACPFRAFAVRRLRAEVLESPHAGLDPREQGMLVHRVLGTVWSELGTRRALEALSESEREALLMNAAEGAIAEERRRRPASLSGRFGAIERERLVRLAKAWLDCDLRRGDFSVAAVEDRRAVTVGPLPLQLRLDRVDETAAGERIVIDYKASKVSLGAMLRRRPDEPQLPLYVVAAEPGAVAAAFAQVCAGRTGFVGLARADGLLPRVPTPETADSRSGAEASWDGQVAFWRAELERLAGDFAAGRAEVDPKRKLLTCRNCAVHPLCRVYERMGTALDED